MSSHFEVDPKKKKKKKKNDPKVKKVKKVSSIIPYIKKINHKQDLKFHFNQIDQQI